MPDDKDAEPVDPRNGNEPKQDASAARKRASVEDRENQAGTGLVDDAKFRRD